MSESWLDDYGVGTPAESLADLVATLTSPSFKGLILAEGWQGRFVLRGGVVSLLCDEQCRGAAHDVQAVLLVAGTRRRVRLLEAVGSRSPVAGLARHAVRPSKVPLTGQEVAVLAALASDRPPLSSGELPRHPMPLELAPRAEVTHSDGTRRDDRTGRDDGTGHGDGTGSDDVTVVRDLLASGQPRPVSVGQWAAVARLLSLGLVRVAGTGACPLLPVRPAPSRRRRHHAPGAGGRGGAGDRASGGSQRSGPAPPAVRRGPAPPPSELPRRVPGARRLSPQARALLQGIASREFSVPGMHVTEPQSPVPPILPRRLNGQRVTERRSDGPGNRGPGSHGSAADGDEGSAAS